MVADAGFELLMAAEEREEYFLHIVT